MFIPNLKKIRVLQKTLNICGSKENDHKMVVHCGTLYRAGTYPDLQRNWNPGPYEKADTMPKFAVLVKSCF